MTITIYVECPDCGEGDHTVNVWPGEPEVRYFADGSGCPGTADEAEIVASECDCLVLEPWFGARILDLAIEQATRSASEA